MARKKKHEGLLTAKAYADILLYQATGGMIGTKIDKDSKDMTFGEKRGLLDSLIKIAALEKEDEGEEELSGFDQIRRQMEKRKKQDARGETWDTGNTKSSSNNGEEANGDPGDSSDQ